MKFEREHVLNGSLTQVMAMFADASFAEVRGNASGATDTDAIIDPHPDGGFTMSMRRTIPAESIPSDMRSVVGGALEVKYTEAWDAPVADRAHGTFAVDISGAPGRVTGTLEAREEDGATTVWVDGEALVRVPLFGAMVEKAVVRAVTDAFEAEFAAAESWLDSHS